MRQCICERCGGTGQQPEGCWSGTAYDSPAGVCRLCGGEGVFEYGGQSEKSEGGKEAISRTTEGTHRRNDSGVGSDSPVSGDATGQTGRQPTSGSAGGDCEETER